MMVLCFDMKANMVNLKELDKMVKGINLKEAPLHHV
jgi:hypothetical protein